ncbi:MAG: adenine phosphoribosyltransferase [Sodaliphilus sp.]
MKQEKINQVKSVVRNVPDFPVPGIQFKDLTTAFKNPEALQIMREGLAELYADKGVTKVVGIEARGFIGGAMLAADLHAGFVPLRKPGKLPAETIKKTYSKEYGTDVIEIHKDAITPDDVVVIHDDLLATGGTMMAAYELVKSMNPKKVYISFICELLGLEGRAIFPADVEVTALFDFPDK